MGENFAFFLPVMMASFATAFLIVWSYKVPAAGWWSAGFFCSAAGFAVPLGYAAFPTPLWSLLADLLFASGFLLFGEALLQRWRPYWQMSTRIVIWTVSVLLCTIAIALDNLTMELMASDFGCFLLIAIPLIAARPHLRFRADRALFCAASLTALDSFIRGSTVSLTIGNGDFIGSDYAFLMQGLACIFGLFLALTALGTQIIDLLAHYEREAMIDPLSGLFNRRGFDDAVGRLAPGDVPGGSLILCDIDHFKAVNDEFGHALGDQVIASLARLMRQLSPKQAIIARFGGEEFIIYLPDVNAARAAEIADDVRESFAREISSRLGLPRPLTASFGLSTAQHGDGSIHDAIARADKALYEAKARGRNRVCVRRALSAPPPPAQRARRTVTA